MVQVHLPRRIDQLIREQFSFVTIRPVTGRRWRVIGSTPRRCADDMWQVVQPGRTPEAKAFPSFTPCPARGRRTDGYLVPEVVGSNPTLSPILRVAQKKSACSGNTRSQVRFLPRRPHALVAQRESIGASHAVSTSCPATGRRLMVINSQLKDVGSNPTRCMRSCDR